MTDAATLPGSLPPISLIICSRGRPRMLADTVASALQGREVPAELVVVDQSAEANAALSGMGCVRGCEVRYIQSASTGLCRARNEAIAVARHELLAFTDDDMHVMPEWLGALARALVVAGPRAAATGRVLAGPQEVPSGFVPALVRRAEAAVYRGRLDRDVLAAGNMALWRGAVDDVGWFDERLGAGAAFPAADDNDFGYRLLEAGYAVVYVPEALLFHRSWRPARDYLPMRWSYGRGKGGFYAKHARWHDRHMLRRAGLDVWRRVRALPRHLLRDRRAVAGDAVYLLGVAAGAAEWFAARLRSRAPRRAGGAGRSGSVADA